MTGDLVVNMSDFLKFREIFSTQQAGGATSAAVPEPGTADLDRNRGLVAYIFSAKKLYPAFRPSFTA